MSSSKVISVFGATGSQGGSVVKALLTSGLYHVRAITRNANSDRANQLKSLKNVSVVEADLDKANTLDSALKESYGVFLVTDFSAHFDNREVQQGKNAIESAIRNGVKHFIFSGLENAKSVIGKPVYHFDYKAEIEQYGLQFADKINFTSIRLPFYFENFISLCTTKVGDNQYIFSPPLANKPFYSLSVDDTGEIVNEVFKHPETYKSKILSVAAEYLTLSEYANIMNKYLAPKTFHDGQISLEQFSKFQFPGVEDLTVMFEYFQTGKMFRDINLTKTLNKNVTSFENWVAKNKDRLLIEIK